MFKDPARWDILKKTGLKRDEKTTNPKKETKEEGIRQLLKGTIGKEKFQPARGECKRDTCEKRIRAGSQRGSLGGGK